ncbi:MAG: hypothetical protein ACI977_000820 [Candidatus Nanohaloarchaea archaeon]|jgi:hypothetical protein
MNGFDEEEMSSAVEEMVEDITETENNTRKNPRKEVIENSKEEQDVGSKIPRSWDPVELDFLINNRTSLGNKELEDFLQEDSEVHEKMEKLSNFSNTEKRFLMEHAQAMNIEQLAERLDREEEVVQLKLESLGLYGV